jgi:transcriptional regulator with XRE-family HTH domain
MDDKDRQQLGRLLRSAREGKGFTIDDVMVELRVRNLPDMMAMSRTKINNIENGTIAKVDPHDVQILAAVYGVTVESLSPAMAEALETFARDWAVIEGGASTESPCTSGRVPVAA